MAQRTVSLKSIVTDTDMTISVQWVCCTNSIGITTWAAKNFESSGEQFWQVPQVNYGEPVDQEISISLSL